MSVKAPVRSLIAWIFLADNAGFVELYSLYLLCGLSMVLYLFGALSQRKKHPKVFFVGKEGEMLQSRARSCRKMRGAAKARSIFREPQGGPYLLYYPLIEILNSLRLDLRHASLPPLAIYLHYALRAAPRLTQIHLANLIQAFYQRIVLSAKTGSTIG